MSKKILILLFSLVINNNAFSSEIVVSIKPLHSLVSAVAGDSKCNTTKLTHAMQNTKRNREKARDECNTTKRNIQKTTKRNRHTCWLRSVVERRFFFFIAPPRTS